MCRAGASSAALPAGPLPRLSITAEGTVVASSESGTNDELCAALGVESENLATALLSQLLTSSVALKAVDDKRANGLFAAVAESHPSSSVEAILAVQSVALSEHVRKVLASAVSVESFDVLERRLSLATRLLAAQRAHIEALHRIQNRGQQKIEVVHVHGQAVVGANIQVNQGVGG